MRLAWFRPGTSTGSSDDLAPVIDGLRNTHDVRLVDDRGAYDFVWQAAQGMFDLCVYELDDTPSHQYIWPYLLHYPGVLALRTSRLHEGRARALAHQRRDLDREAELAFADGATRSDPPWPLVRGAWSTWRIPVLASRLTVVVDDALAATIRESCPGARVVVTPAGVADPLAAPGRGQAVPERGEGSLHDRVLRVLVCDGASPRVAERAAGRARQAGAALEIAYAAPGNVDAVAAADAIVATRWPTFGRPLTAALAALAAGKPVMVAETASTARWPALDPQTWQPRSIAAGVGSADAPIVISIDPRDEEHSLMLALVRLAGDAALRASLGGAARAWWERHAAVPLAVAAWQEVLGEARASSPPPRPASWPAHLDDDGSRLARETLEQFGIDFRM